MRRNRGTLHHAITVLTASAASAAVLGVAVVQAGATPIVNDPPVARATATPDLAHVGAPVTLDGSGSTDEETPAGDLLYSWEFGDGTPATDPSTANFEVPHTYATAGVYTATLTVADPQGLSDTDQVVINVDDTAPVAAASADPATVKVQHVVRFDASGSSDAETPDQELTFDWDFKDGETGSGIAPTHTYSAAGRYPVELTVTDPQGVSDTATVTITVTNTVPTADGSFSPAAPHVGESVTFDATTSTDAETPRALTYEWDFGAGTVPATTAVATHTFATTGAKTVKLKVTDPQGLTSTRTFNFSVTANGAPTAVATTSRAKANVGQTVTFDGTGSSDPEGTGLTYSWDFGDGGSNQDATGPVANRAFTSPGAYPITLTVTDSYGLTGSDAVTVQVGNEAPTAAFAVNPDPAYALQAVTFDAGQSADAETPDQLSYSWLFGDGTSTAYSTSPQTTHEYTADGTYSVTLRVKDAKGAIGTQTHGLDVLPNAAPVAAASASPNPVHIGGKVTFDGTGSTDPDGDVLTYRWDFPNGRDATGATVQRTFSTAGTFEVALTVTDTHGVKDTTVVTVTVVNDAPAAAFTTSRGIHYAGRTMSFSGESSQDSETPDELTYAWDFGDGDIGNGATPTHTYASAGAYDVTLTVTDPQGLTDSVTRTVYIAAELACRNAAVRKSAHWRIMRNPAASGGNYCDNLSGGNPAGGRMSLTVTGPRIGMSFARSTAGGTARVTIDGVLVGRIHFHSSTNDPSFGYRKVYTGLGEGPHSVSVKMVRGVGYLDSFLVYGTTE